MNPLHSHQIAPTCICSHVLALSIDEIQGSRSSVSVSGSVSVSAVGDLPRPARPRAAVCSDTDGDSEVIGVRSSRPVLQEWPSTPDGYAGPGKPGSMEGWGSHPRPDNDNDYDHDKPDPCSMQYRGRCRSRGRSRKYPPSISFTLPIRLGSDLRWSITPRRLRAPQTPPFLLSKSPKRPISERNSFPDSEFSCPEENRGGESGTAIGPRSAIQLIATADVFTSGEDVSLCSPGSTAFASPVIWW